MLKNLFKKEDKRKKAEELINSMMLCKTLVENKIHKEEKGSGEEIEKLFTEIENYKQQLLELF